MCPQQQGQRRESEMVVPSIYVTQRIDTDRPDRDPTDEIRLRGEAHTRRLAGAAESHQDPGRIRSVMGIVQVQPAAPSSGKPQASSMVRRIE